MQMTKWAKVTLSQSNFGPVIKPKINNICKPYFEILFGGFNKGKWSPGFGLQVFLFLMKHTSCGPNVLKTEQKDFCYFSL
jgi:hypothetical protein